jgi:TM2 domain-containing membrane protein YozV
MLALVKFLRYTKNIAINLKMSEFTIFEQQQISKKLKAKDQQLFNAQYDSVKKDPGTMLILSVLLGYIGVDRFMLQDMGFGLLKLFTFGGCGVLWLIDIFTTKERTAEYNRKKANEIFQSLNSD